MDAFEEYDAVEVDEDALPEYSLEEVSKHASVDDMWIVIAGKVYDVTDWQHDHPGGDDVLQVNAGKDATNLFRQVGHSVDAMNYRTHFVVGKLKPNSKI